MNELNVASFEASQRLYEAGIVLETEAVWSFSTTGWELIKRNPAHIVGEHYLPAPSMAEVLMKLPRNIEGHYLSLAKVGGYVAYYGTIYNPLHSARNINPTDALIYLLIWVKATNREKIVKKLIDQAEKLKW